MISTLYVKKGGGRAGVKVGKGRVGEERESILTQLI